MTRHVLWELSIVLTQATAEEAAMELFATRYGEPTSSYTDIETGKTIVSMYFEKKPDWSKQSRRDLRLALKAIEQLEQPGAAQVRLRKLQAKDWTEAWKRHFKPLRIGRQLLIQPSWSRTRPRRGEIPVILDPGMSFGTGQHPTTEFCLAELVRARRQELVQSFLDVGTGSGILAIGAAKLGYQPVLAFDLDRAAVSIARANAQYNAVERFIRFECRDLASFKPTRTARYDVVCANLLADIIIAERDRLISLVATGGRLVLAGILNSEFETVRRHYEQAGVRLLHTRGQKEWRSGCFAK